MLYQCSIHHVFYDRLLQKLQVRLTTFFDLKLTFSLDFWRRGIPFFRWSMHPFIFCNIWSVYSLLRTSEVHFAGFLMSCWCIFLFESASKTYVMTNLILASSVNHSPMCFHIHAVVNPAVTSFILPVWLFVVLDYSVFVTASLPVH